MAKDKIVNSKKLVNSSIFQALLLKSSLFQDILSIMNKYTIILDKDDFEELVKNNTQDPKIFLTWTIKE
jgi:hypothetical protein